MVTLRAEEPSGDWSSEFGIHSVLAAATAELIRRYAADDRTLLEVEEAESTSRRPIVVDLGGSPTLVDLASRVRDSLHSQGASLTPSGEPDGNHPHSSFLVRVSGHAVTSPSGSGNAVEIALSSSSSSEAVLTLFYDRNYLHDEEGARFGERLAALLRAALAEPLRPIEDHELLTSPERDEVMRAAIGPTPIYPRDASVTEILREVVEAYPEIIAVEEPARQVTYRELAAWMAIVREVLMEAGVAPGSCIGVTMGRSAEMIASFAGILDAGCAYLPFDRGDPPSRLSEMLRQAEVATVLIRSEEESQARALVESIAPGAKVLVVPDLPPTESWDGKSGLGSRKVPGGLAAAYVMFTSGSTGAPKGVRVPHRGILRLILGADYADFPPGERVLGFAPPTFDPSTFEIWGPLLTGGTLVLAPPGPISLGDLASYIEERAITTILFAAALFSDIVEYHLGRLHGVRQFVTGGDVVSPSAARALLLRFPGIRLINAYGPTENTTFSTCRTIRTEDLDARSLPIGQTIANSTVRLLDAQGRPVPPGMVGELYVGGDGIALGYENRPDLTAERFVMLTPAGGEAERLFKTGDLGRLLSDGVFEFLGRVDDQVKIRGHRVEPGEVEIALEGCDGVAATAVVAVGLPGSRRLRGVIVLREGSGVDAHRLRAALRDRLPGYMIPSEFVFLDRLPLTRHGKVDRRSLSEIDPPAISAVAHAEGEETITATLTEIWSDLLPGRSFGPDDPFFDAGGDSLLGLRMVEELRLRAGVVLPAVRVFEFPTIRGLSRHIVGRGDGHEQPREAAVPGQASTARGPVAIIGIAGRFPGAESVDELWDLLEGESDAITRFSASELEVPAELAARPGYVAARGILSDVAGFDEDFFRMTPREAEIADPQMRVLLETAWRALEDGGIPPGDGRTTTGVYVGVSHNTYFDRNLLTHPALLEEYGFLRALFGNDRDYIATFLAHRLDLRGPAVTVQTASSTSLTAVALAVQAIRTGMCEVAIAGGASVTVPVRSGYLYEEGAMQSRDGDTRTFDASSSGTVFSDGVGVVVLKELEAARRDGDKIYAVVHGVGISNDGAMRASFTSPTVAGQSACVSGALKDAGWSAATVSYVEAHGTGTPLGDPIEIEALTRAFRTTTDRKRFCAIGSLKSNIGHLSAAAGVAGLVKVVLAMQNRWIPGTLHFERANPQIDFENSPFVVARKGVPWETEGAPRRAGVSSFGAGGTNVHVLIEEWREETLQEPENSPVLLPLSAASEVAFRSQAEALAHRLEAGRPPLPWVARTLQEGRRPFAHRGFIVAGDESEAVAKLREMAAGALPSVRASSNPIRPIFLFPGQGAQRVGMGSELYDAFPEVREILDRCDDLLGPVRGKSILDWTFGRGMSEAEARAGLIETDVAQPALFAIEYAIASALMGWGIRPDAMIGHSLGEWTAACLSGVMDLETALPLVRERGKIMAAMPLGSMVAIRSGEDEVRSLLGPDVVIAVRNAPRLIVAAGPTEAVDALLDRLREAGIAHRHLATSHAFHSPMMERAAKEFESVMAGAVLRTPEIPFIACPSGRLITAGEATSPRYWASQIREPVLLGEGMAFLGEMSGAHFLEVGPGRTLGSLVPQNAEGRLSATTLDTDGPGVKMSEMESLLDGIGRIWQIGFNEVNWSALAGGRGWRRTSLPGHPLQRRRRWIDPATPGIPEGDSGESHPERGAATSLSAVMENQARILRSQSELLKAFRSRS